MYSTNHGNLPGDEEVLWRYLSFSKLVDLLQRGKLFFCRLDRLRLVDSHEYSNTSPIFCPPDPASCDRLFPELRSQPEEVQRAILEDQQRLRTQMENHHKAAVARELRNMAAQAVCCWRHDSAESHAMWQIYAPAAEGVAIRTTVGRLKAALVDKRTIDLGIVSYYDSAKNFLIETSDIGQRIVEVGSQTNIDQCLHKQPWYAYENEIRALLVNDKFPAPLKDLSLYVDVDLSILIEAIVLSPTSASWFENVVRGVTGSFAERIRRSSMASPPQVYRPF